MRLVQWVAPEGLLVGQVQEEVEQEQERVQQQVGEVEQERLRMLHECEEGWVGVRIPGMQAESGGQVSREEVQPEQVEAVQRNYHCRLHQCLLRFHS